MKSFDARSLVVAVAGQWATPSRSQSRLNSYQKLPGELLAIAERARSLEVKISGAVGRNSLKSAK